MPFTTPLPSTCALCLPCSNQYEPGASGRLCRGIARFALNCHEPALDTELVKQLRLEEMIAQVLSMLELAKQALQEESQELATAVFAKDNMLDEINAEPLPFLPTTSAGIRRVHSLV